MNILERHVIFLERDPALRVSRGITVQGDKVKGNFTTNDLALLLEFLVPTARDIDAACELQRCRDALCAIADRSSK